MKSIYTSESFKDEMVRDIYNYHYYFGNIMVQDTLVNYTDAMENKLGGSSIPVDGTVSIKTNMEAGVIMINDTKKVDKDRMNAVIQEAGKMLKGKNKKKLKNGLHQNGISINEIENYTYDFEYGWLKYYEKNRITRASNSNNRQERFIIMREVE